MIVTDELFYGLCDAWSDIHEHLPTFAALVRALDARKVLELGVRSGVSTAAWLWALQDTGGKLWACDLDACPEAFRELPDEQFVFTRGGDCAPDVLARHKAASPFDIVFVDTSHEYAHTLTELRLYTPLVRPGGLVLGHDTESFPEGVKRAFSDFCEETGRTWFNDARCNGLAMIRV